MKHKNYLRKNDYTCRKSEYLNVHNAQWFEVVGGQERNLIKLVKQFAKKVCGNLILVV